MQAFRRRIFDVPHIEIKPSAVEQKTAIARRFFIIAVVQVDRASARFAKKMIFHPHRPGVAVQMWIVAAGEATVFGFDSDDPIHCMRASITSAPWTRRKTERRLQCYERISVAQPGREGWRHCLFWSHAR